MNDPTFRYFNILFFQSFNVGENDPMRNSFLKSYIPLVEIEDFNAITDNEPFFDQPVKHKGEVHEKRVYMSRNDDYATGNLLDYLFHQKYYKLINIGLSKQTNRTIP